MVSAYAIEFGVFQLNLQSRNNLNPNSQGSGFLFYLCKVRQGRYDRNAYSRKTWKGVVTVSVCCRVVLVTNRANMTQHINAKFSGHQIEVAFVRVAPNKTSNDLSIHRHIFCILEQPFLAELLIV